MLDHREMVAPAGEESGEGGGKAGKAVHQRRHSAREAARVAQNACGGMAGMRGKIEHVGRAHEAGRQVRTGVGGAGFTEDDGIDVVALREGNGGAEAERRAPPPARG